MTLADLFYAKHPRERHVPRRSRRHRRSTASMLRLEPLEPRFLLSSGPANEVLDELSAVVAAESTIVLELEPQADAPAGSRDADDDSPATMDASASAPTGADQALDPAAVTGVDLVVTAATAPATALAGESVSVSWTVTNQGTSGTGTYYTDRVYLSRDQVLGGSVDYQMDAQLAFGIAAGGSYTRTRTVSMPLVDHGAWYVLFVADVDFYGASSVAEADETNNVLARPITINAPDLVVTDLAAPATWLIGDSISVSWTVTNRSAVNAIADWQDWLYLSTDQVISGDDTLVTLENVTTQTPVAAGASYTITASVTTGASAGSWYLLLATDFNNAQRETDETNNVLARPITLAVPGSDLIVSAASAPATALAGQTIPVSWTVTNQGTRDAAFQNWEDSLYLSRDTTRSDDDRFVASQSIVAPLAVGASYTIARNVTLPSGEPPFGIAGGAWYLLFIADSFSLSLNDNETDETNNVYALPLTIPAPDLVVSAASVPDSAVAGATVEISWTVTNQGAEVASRDWYDQVFFSRDQTRSDDDISVALRDIVAQTPLAAGASYTFTTQITIPSVELGGWYVLIVADRYGYQPEVDDGNNVRAVPITLDAPDLVVTAASVPASALSGELVNVSWTVMNQGGVAAGEDWFDAVLLSLDATLSADDTLLVYPSTAAETPLGPGASYTLASQVRIPFGTASGPRHLLFVADRYGHQGESDEGNNLFAVPIAIGAADLSVTAGSAPSSASGGERVVVSWTVTNQGTVAAAADWSDLVYLSRDEVPSTDDAVLHVEPIAAETPLAPGGSYTRAREMTVPSVPDGAWNVLVVADGFTTQGEIDEANNVRILPISLVASDLTVSAFTVPDTAIVGDHVTVSWTVTNQGAAGARTDWADTVYLSRDTRRSVDDHLLHRELITDQTPLASGAGYTVERDVTVPHVPFDIWYVIVATDADNRETESRETNNVRALPISLFAPDLVVSAVGAPASAVVGEDVSVSWTVTNQEFVTASGDWHDVLYLSRDQGVGVDDYVLHREQVGAVTPLAPGSAYTVTRGVRMPSVEGGDWYILVVTDENGEQGETEDANNIGAALITLSAPDLAISAASGPPDAVVGEAVRVSWTVTNRGTAGAGADWSDGLYLSRDQTLGGGDFVFHTTSIAGQPPLAVAGSYTVTAEATLLQVEPGAWYVIVVADRIGQQAESDETNNLYALPITLAAPDLAMSAIDAPAGAVVGERVSVTWTVTNQGSVAALADWTDKVLLSRDATPSSDDRSLGNRHIETETPLAAGASYTVTHEVAVPPAEGGDWFLLVVTDVANGQGETDEANNAQASPFQVSGPDLAVDDVTLPAAVRFGDPIQVTWTVRNRGSSEVLVVWDDRLWLSKDAILDHRDVSLVTVSTAATLPLAPGAASTQSATVTLPLGPEFAEGEYFLLVETDAREVVPEVAETNVTASAAVSITLPPLPDLTVSDVAAPLEAFAGQQIPISWTLTNAGPGETRGAWDDRVWLSSDPVPGGDVFLGLFRFDGMLGAGRSITRTQLVTVPADVRGDAWIVVQTDAEDDVFERSGGAGNTTVDDRPVVVRLEPSANLRVTQVTPPTAAFSSQQAAVEWQVTNTGTGATSAAEWFDDVYLSFDTVLDASDFRLGEVRNPSYLGAGESYRQSLAVTLPHGLDASFFFLVVTDARGDVVEREAEDDNLGTGGPVPVHLTPPADLVVSSMVPPPTGFSGQPLRLAWTITNQGSGPTLTNHWSDFLYMSDDDVLDSGDRLLSKVIADGFHGFTAVEAGASYDAAATVTLPIGVSGEAFFFVRADGFNNVYEHTSEENNTGRVAGRVLLTPPPDLETPNVVVPGTALAGHPLAISYQVANLGSSPATATSGTSWTDAFYVSTDTVLDEGDHRLGTRVHSGALNVDAWYTKTVTFTIPDTLTGQFHVIAVADEADRVFELDNANNTGVSPGVVTIESRPPDLEVSAVQAPATAEAGTAVPVTWTVTNSGTGPTAATTWIDRVVLRSEDGPAGDILLAHFSHHGALGSGEISVRTEVVTLPVSLAGPFRLFVVTDANADVLESNETNNASGLSALTISREAPDLQVTQVSAPDTARAGEPLPLQWTVVNAGTNRTNASFWYDVAFLSRDLVLDGSDLRLGDARRANALAAGETYDASAIFVLPGTVPAATYRILVRADGNDHVAEQPFEDNNVRASAPLAIASELLANLVVADVDAPAEAMSGQPFSVTWTVRNIGAAPATAFTDVVYLSRDQVLDGNDQSLGFHTVAGGLAAGASAIVTHAFAVPRGLSGPFYVFVVTDRSGQVRETDELGNAGYDQTSMLVSLAPPADLLAGTVTVPSSAVSGRDAVVTYTVGYDGSSVFVGSWVDALYISADDRWEVDDVLFARAPRAGGLLPGSSYTGSVTAPMPGVVPGLYHVIVRADVLNQVPELAEANNVAVSLDRVTVDAEPVVLGAPLSATLGSEQSAFYRLDVPGGDTVRLRLDGDAADGASELYVRFGAMPTRGQFDVASVMPFTTDQELVVPATQAGTYYVLVFRSSARTAFHYSLAAETVPFSIVRVGTTEVGNHDESTLDIHGALFTSGTRFQLVGPGGESAPEILDARRVLLADSATAFVTFEFSEAATGLYDVRAVQPDGATTLLEDAVRVVDGEGGHLEQGLTGHAEVRPDRLNLFTLDYANTGDADLAAPLFVLESDVPVGFTAEAVAPGTLHVLGASIDGPMDVLRAGSRSTIPFLFRSPGSGGQVSIHLESALASDDRPIEDWAAIEAAVRPVAIADADWQAFWGRIQPRIGTTWGDYATLLDRLVVKLSEPGRPIRDVRALFAALYAQDPTFQPSAAFSGRMLDARTGDAVADLEVTAYRIDGHEGVAEASAVTGADGRFAFPRLEPGTYALGLVGRTIDMDRDGVDDLVPPRFTVTDQADVADVTVYLQPVIEPSALVPESDAVVAQGPDGTSHVLWRRDERVWHARFDGSDWVDAAPVSDAPGTGLNLLAGPTVIDGQTPGLLALWAQGTGNQAETYYAVARFGDESRVEWSAPVRLTDDEVQDSAPTAELVGPGQALIVSLKQDTEIRDDTDLYWSLLDVASGNLVWSVTVPAAPAEEIDPPLEPSDAGAQFAVTSRGTLGPWSLGGMTIKVMLDGQWASSRVGCNASLQGQLALTGEFDGANSLRATAQGSLGGAAEYTVDKKHLDWKFDKATVSGSFAVGFDWKHALLGFLSAVPEPTIALTARSIRSVIDLINGSGLVELEDGINFNVGYSVKGEYQSGLPFPRFVAPEKPKEHSLTIMAGPYIKAAVSKENAEIKLSGQIKWTQKLAPVYQTTEVTGNLQFDAQWGSWIYSVIATGGYVAPDEAEMIGPSSLEASQADQDIVFVLNREAALGTGNVYGPGTLLASAPSDITEDGVPSLAIGADGRSFAAWAKDAGPDEPQGQRVLVSEFDGSSWSSPTALPASFGLDADVSAVVDGDGRRLVVWSMADPSALETATTLTFDQLANIRAGSDLVYSIFDDGAWSIPHLIQATSGEDGSVALAREPDGDVVLAWVNRGADGRHHLRSATWSEGAWTPPAEVAVAAAIGRPVLGQVAGNTTLFWTQDLNPGPITESGLYASALGGAAWSGPVRFNPVLPVSSGTEPAAALPDLHTESHRFLPPVPDKCLPEEHRDDDDDDDGGGDDYEPVVVSPIDPNDILGPDGFGQERWVRAVSALPYTIRFENAPEAQAPAQQVVVTQQLDPDLDPRSFRVDDFGWGGLRFEVPGDKGFLSQRLDLREQSGYFVDVAAAIDVVSGVATWTITTIDPATGEPPVDAQSGFLPPDDATGRGEGFVSYTVRPRRTAATGAVVDAQARIVFDTEAPIDTPPIFNTLDAVTPASVVEALPATMTTSEFQLRWSGTDDADGSAIGNFAVFVSEDGGPFDVLVAGTTATELQFTGVEGRRYAFYTSARDNSGNVEAPPPSPDAEVLLLGETGTISGAKFEDIDGDGVRDAEEPGLAGWTIFLDSDADGMLDAGEISTVTGADGSYSFTLLPPGSYVVSEVMQPGWMQTAPGIGRATSQSSAAWPLTTTGADVLLDTPGEPIVADLESAAAGSVGSAHRLAGLDALRADTRFAGLDGDGVTTVIVDTGIDVDHAFFGRDRNGDGVADRIVYQWDFADGDADASDRMGHGSMVASVVGSEDDASQGVAPAADLVVLKVFEDAGRGYFSYLERALQWVVQHGRAYGVGVVNLSVGDGGNWSSLVSQYGLGDELAALAAQDVIVVAAAGNAFAQFGSATGVAYPAADPAVLAVGAVWVDDFGGPWQFRSGAIDYQTGVDRIASFSQRDGSLIDTFAPGARLTGAGPTGGVVSMQGTSQASAYVAGAATLAQQLAQETLGRRLSTGEFAALLRGTGDRILDGDDEQDNVANTGLFFPRVDLVRLAEAIVALDAAPGGATTDPPAHDDVEGPELPAAPIRAMGAHAVTVAGGQAVTDVDFGNFTLAEIAGTVFHDVDQNGVRDESEPGLAGFAVYLDQDRDGARGATEPRVTTGADGQYVFHDLAPGLHVVAAGPDPDWVATDPAGGRREVSMTSGLAIAGADFGHREPNAAPRVTSFIGTHSGFRVQLGRSVDVSALNLYDAQGAARGPADVTLIGAARGPIRGSLIADALGTTFTFVRTGGVLEADTYTARLRSTVADVDGNGQPDGFTTSDGTPLDGDGDGVAGGDFVATFTVSPKTAVVSIPDVMRGPGQAVKIPATDTGIPVVLTGGTGTTSLDVTILYDPALLEVTAVSRGGALPLDTTLVADLGTRGRVVLQLGALTPLSVGPVELATLSARVPASAPYGAAHVLDVAASVNGDLGADDGVHVVGYLGDATGDAVYSAEDARRILRVAVRSDSGFAAYPRIDPVVVADATRNGAISSLDATRLLQELAGIDRPEIPPRPPSSPAVASVAPSPSPTTPAMADEPSSGSAAAGSPDVGSRTAIDEPRANHAAASVDLDEGITMIVGATTDSVVATGGILPGGRVPAPPIRASAVETPDVRDEHPIATAIRRATSRATVAYIDWSHGISTDTRGEPSRPSQVARLSFDLFQGPERTAREAELQAVLIDWDAGA